MEKTKNMQYCETTVMNIPTGNIHTSCALSLLPPKDQRLEVTKPTWGIFGFYCFKGAERFWQVLDNIDLFDQKSSV